MHIVWNFRPLRDPKNVQREHSSHTRTGSGIRMSLDFSTAIMGQLLKILREIYFQSRTLHPAEPAIKATGIHALPKQGNKPCLGAGVGGKAESKGTRKQDPTQERIKGNFRGGSKTRSQDNGSTGL